MFKRKPKTTFAEQMEATTEANLAYAQANRLPRDDVVAVCFLAERRSGVEAPELLSSFLAGYDYGQRAQLFLIPTPEMGGLIDSAAVAWLQRQRLGFDGDQTGRASAIYDYLPAVLSMIDRPLLANADATPFDSPHEAYEVWASEQAQTPVEQAAGFFHQGAAFFAFETQLLLAILRMGRR